MRAMIWLAVASVGAGLVTACKDSQKPNENLAPTANFSFQCSALRCDFHDSSSDDVAVVGWSWNFGTDGSTAQNPIYNYPSAGSYPVTLTVTDGDGLSNSVTKNVDPKEPAVTTLSCVDGSVPGGFVACTLRLEAEAGFKVVLNSSDCQAHGNTFKITSPVQGTLTTDGCYETPNAELPFPGPFPAGTEISAEVIAPVLKNAPQLLVSGEYPVWTLKYEDGFDTDFNDMEMTLTALPTGH